jgi:putative transposase
MVRYRRLRTAGGSYFFTVALRNRRADTLVTHIQELRHAIEQTRALRPFDIDAMVVLPDHLHAVWTLPQTDSDYSGRWRSIKSGFVRALRADGMTLVANAKGEHSVWQRRFWEHQIRDEEDMQRHVDYVHINPVKHGLVQRAVDWPWSSFHRFVRDGLLAADWACAPDGIGGFGE